MPFKSKAQVAKFYAMAEKGEISEGTLRRWIRESPPLKDLPERAKQKKRTKANA